VDDDLQAKRASLSELIVEAVDAIDLALEEKTRVRILAGHEKLAVAVAAYDQVFAAASAAEKMELEKRFGRRITDLKRQTSRLPRGEKGRAAELSRDAGSVPFIEQRAPGKSIQEIAGPPRDRSQKRPKYTVGGEVEAWCGPCGGLRTHNIFALLDDEPQQVICQACGGRHGFRTTPARKGTGLAESAPPVQRSRGPTAEQIEAEKKERAKMELRKELQTAEKVRSFSPKERYKAGEIIEHPEHGRGKVETVTRGSILVRFGHGLRPLDLT
jgi:hypothetical protein